MVTIKKKHIGKQNYFYLEHTIRKGNKFQKKTKYLGKKQPENLELLKKQFLSEIYKEKYFPSLNKIKINYLKELKKTPKPAKEKQKEIFSTRFTYDTQRIEGSTLTLRETADLLEKGITPKRPLQDVKEAENHQNLFYEILDYKKDLSLQIILHWHKKLFENTEKEAIAGKLRKHQVAISGSKFIPAFPAEIYPLLREFFSWYNKNKAKFHPVELAALVHLKFVTIHPFSDGNGRISRLMMSFVLNKHKYPLLNIHYENRTSYYNALERSQVKKDETIFLNWFFKRYLKEYKRFSK
ncbi:MAG: Fic family protein [Nanoarchaeota archaeon]